MRIAWFGLDLFAPGLEALLDKGAEVTALFTAPGDGLTDFSNRITALARSRNIPVFCGKPERHQVQALFARDGTDFILSAYYPYRIPVEGIAGFRGFNLHPGFLPEDRGPWPQVQAFDKGWGGVTLHRLEERFDTGAIVLQKKLPLTEYDTIDTLNARIQLAGRALLLEFIDHWEALDNAAIPQGPGHYDPMPDPAAWTLTGQETIAQARQMLRRFGRCGCFVRLPEGDVPVTAAWLYPEAHGETPGRVSIRNEKDLVLAFRDGYGVLVCETENET